MVSESIALLINVRNPEAELRAISTPSLSQTTQAELLFAHPMESLDSRDASLMAYVKIGVEGCLGADPLQPSCVLPWEGMVLFLMKGVCLGLRDLG